MNVASEIRTAVHEAGHAVVAMILGVVPSEAVIDPVVSNRGHVAVPSDLPPRTRALIVAGGLAAESLAFGDRSAAIDDRDELGDAIDHLVAEARDLLGVHFDVVDELSLALLERGTVTGDELGLLFRKMGLSGAGGPFGTGPAQVVP